MKNENVVQAEKLRTASEKKQTQTYMLILKSNEEKMPVCGSNLTRLQNQKGMQTVEKRLLKSKSDQNALKYKKWHVACNVKYGKIR